MTVNERIREKLADTCEDFEIQKGDSVTVRVREHGTTGNIRAKIHGECLGFRTRSVGSPPAVIAAPWGDTVDLRWTEAEFEVVE